LYNLNCTSTTLGVQSSREIAFGGRRTQKDSTPLPQHLLYVRALSQSAESTVVTECLAPEGGSENGGTKKRVTEVAKGREGNFLTDQDDGDSEEE
jgi:hypothetical protein